MKEKESKVNNTVFENLLKKCETEEGKRSIIGGQSKALRAYLTMKEEGFEMLLMDDFLWDNEVKDFTDLLKEAGVTEFLYSNTSTALMDNIVSFDKEGYRLDGYTQIETKSYWGRKINALIFRLK